MALGKVDYIEVVGFSDHKSTAAGLVPAAELRIPFADGGGHGCHGQLCFPARTGGPEPRLRQRSQGRLNIGVLVERAEAGEHLRPTVRCSGSLVGGREVGEELRLPAGENKVKFTAWMRSFVPIDHLEVICNGKWRGI